MAATVTPIILEAIRNRDRQILDGTEAVLTLLEEVRSQIVTELATTSGDSYSAFMMRQNLASINEYLARFETGANAELASRISAGWELGISMLPAVAGATGVTGSFGWISPHLIDALKEFTFGRIANVRSTAYERIRGELTLGILGQKTPQEIATAIAGTLDSPSIFKTIQERAEVITGTEIGRAFSLATQKSMEAAADILPGLKKMWLHAGHPRVPRIVHLNLHGVIRDMDKPFYRTPEGAAVSYPRDPNAPIKEVIRCGCTHVPYHPDWGPVAEFRNDFDELQYNVNT